MTVAVFTIGFEKIAPAKEKKKNTTGMKKSEILHANYTKKKRIITFEMKIHRNGTL